MLLYLKCNSIYLTVHASGGNQTCAISCSTCNVENRSDNYAINLLKKNLDQQPATWFLNMRQNATPVKTPQKQRWSTVAKYLSSLYHQKHSRPRCTVPPSDNHEELLLPPHLTRTRFIIWKWCSRAVLWCRQLKVCSLKSIPSISFCLVLALINGIFTLGWFSTASAVNESFCVDKEHCCSSEICVSRMTIVTVVMHHVSHFCHSLVSTKYVCTRSWCVLQMLYIFY